MHPVLIHIGSLVIPSYGATAAVGVLLALLLALRSARRLGMDANKIWNLSILMLFTALVGSRLMLVIANWTVLRHHPLWMLSLGIVHHPLLAGIGAVLALAIAAVYARIYRLPFRVTADALSAPAALVLAFEQFGALLSGAGFGTGTHLPWAVTYTDPLAERWSGAPLDIPVHPVQAYVAICFLAITLGLILWLPHRHQNGDLAGIFFMASGSVLFFTEFWRDPIGRGALFQGVLKAPQAADILLVLAGCAILCERPSERIALAPVLNDSGLSNSANLERPSHG